MAAMVRVVNTLGRGLTCYYYSNTSKMDMLEESSGQRHGFFVHKLDCERGMRQ